MPEHSETFQSTPKHFVTRRCHSLGFVAELAGPLAFADDLNRSAVLPAFDRFHGPVGRARQQSPPMISMAAYCAHAGPTSRHTRRSRLPDRKAARRRRGLDGRRAVVTRITAALMLGLLRLYCGPHHDLTLACHLQCVGCDKKILWPSVGLSLGLIGTCWYLIGLIGSL